jgi:capsular polysaccharide export protein
LKLPAVVFACGFSFNKRRLLRRFAADSRIHFVKDAGRVPAGATLLLWGSASLPRELATGVTIVRLEDGFLRSVGLGAELVSPVSWVMDARGIYYDATRASDLEQLLQSADFPDALIERAARLRRRIVAAGLTKYNVGHGEWSRPPGAGQVILVPGQVESDASLRLGAPDIRTNIALLRAVRAANPAAYLIYKPHPDVTAGIRAGGVLESEARRFCDSVVTHVAMDTLLKSVDEVHVLTSLAGFEALLREKTVSCYGLPFYAGWGLTRDRLRAPRRGRRLTLDQLVAGALISYPLYVSRTTRRRISVEAALEELLQWRQRAPLRPQLWQYLWRPLLRLAASGK